MTKFVILLWIFIKSTCTSFAGLASLPEIRHELVEDRHWLTNEQIDQSIVITRTTPGPVGVWVVSAGYTADGVPGAVAGWIAMTAPWLVVILLVGYFGRRAQHPRVRSMHRRRRAPAAGDEAHQHAVDRRGRGRDQLRGVDGRGGSDLDLD